MQPILEDALDLAHGLLREMVERVLQQLGRLVKLQVLFPSRADERLRTVVVDCLGATVGRRCLAMVDNDEDASAEEVKVPRREYSSRPRSLIARADSAIVSCRHP